MQTPGWWEPLQRASLLFVRLGLAAIVLLFLGGFGFALSGILAAILVGLLFAVFTVTGPMEVINQAYAAHPWGIAAWLVTAAEVATLLVAARMAWRLSAQLLQALPETIKPFTCLSLVAFLVLEAGLNTLSFPPTFRLAREQRTIEGQVLGVYPQQHGSITYTYTVDGRRFDNGGSPENLAALQPGSPVRVYYAAGEPSLCGLREPWSEARDNLINNLAVGVFVSVAPLGLVAGRDLLVVHFPPRKLGTT